MAFFWSSYLNSASPNISLPFVLVSIEIPFMSQFHLFTMVYGAHHVGLFKRACFKSLMWPRNFSAIKGCSWVIYTKKEHFEEFQALFKDREFDLHLVDIGDSIRVAGCGYVPTSQVDGGVILLDGLRQQVHVSITHKSKVLFAPPDTIFGDGTVPNLLKLGYVPKTCVAVAHPRVLPSILDEIDILGATRGGVSNASLVSLAFSHAHDSWKFSEIGNSKNNSFIGGISWQKLEGGLWSVAHRLPTNYLCDFNETDFDFWWGQVSFGAFDHRWPAENLIRQQRQRYCGSSDACFVVEVTDWDKNVPPVVDLEKIKHMEKDAYWNAHYHNEINRGVNAIFRGE